MSIIDDTVQYASQSWTRTVTCKINDHAVRAVVTRDFYDRQSRLHSDVFSKTDLRWNQVQSLSGLDYRELPGASCRDADLIRSETGTVIEDLLAYAALVLDTV